MKTLTYGTLPSWPEFEAAYEREVGERGYGIRLGSSDAQNVGQWITQPNYDAEHLYAVVSALTAAYNYGKDEPGDMASSILFTLGFEWI